MFFIVRSKFDVYLGLPVAILSKIVYNRKKCRGLALQERRHEMEQELLNIISFDSKINMELLDKHTNYLDITRINEIKWDQVEHLYILGMTSNSEQTPEEGFYVSFDAKWALVHHIEIEQSKMILSQCGRNLLRLDIRNMSINNLDVSAMSNLQYLFVWGAFIGNYCRVSGIEQCQGLIDITLLCSAPKTTLDVSQLSHLRTLQIIPLKKALIGSELVSGFQQLQELEYLVLNGSYNRDSIDVSAMSSLKILQLSSTRVLRYVEGLARLSHLESLDLSGTGIMDIPDDVRQLKSLKQLNLSSLSLNELPDWLPEMELDFHMKPSASGISLWQTNVKDVDMSIFEQPQEMIRQWFEARKKGNEVPLNEIKVVFLGDGEAGKSHTIARLLNDGGKPLDYTDKATPGIVIKNKEYELDGRKIQVHFWDFGGQEILHSMHRIFLTERTLYVVLVNARDETQDARARYWLHNIKSFAKDAPVILALNKIDQNPTAEVNRRDLLNKYDNLRRVIKLSAKEYNQDHFNREFTDALLDEIQQTKYLDVTWPIPWRTVKEELEQMGSNYIRGAAYREICHRCGVDTNQKNLLHWFNDLGVSFCCYDDYRLDNYVILRPDWITNALYIILFNKCEGANNGLIPHSSIKNVLGEDVENPDTIHRVLPDVYYDWDEIQYVLEVFRKSQLSFDAGDEHEFIPMLCDPNSSPVAEWYEKDEDTLEFRMDFDYLPNNVLHQLMVDRKVELQMDNVWRTGALFMQEETGLSAVVTLDEKTLRILVRSSDPMHKPNTYLSMLKANVDRIWKKMGLQKPSNKLVYKLNSKQEIFDYELLTAMLDAGQRQIFSMTWRQMLNIWDIMNQSAPATTADQEKLLGHIITACQHLQANKMYWDVDENDRSTVVRNILRTQGYIIHDQTLQGISGGEKKPGELDMDIRRYENAPWTICEALRINDGSKTGWNSHLAKLLDNYNPHGASFLFLLTYVDCEKDKFDQIWESFEDHIKGHSAERFAYILESYALFANEQWADNHFIKTARCQYECGSYTPTVYHIFVRMGR